MKLSRKVMTLALLLVSMVGQGMAQQMPPLPIDPAVRYGKLENGLTYYVRHNEHPKDRAEFYIAQNVGSVLEEEEQRGLAHFLEHMAFNGTKNFPGKSMLNYLEVNGVKFGVNVNAYTGFDETVYNLSNVPVTRQGMVDSCLLILHDWASAISLEEAEIDNERGVIQEEWRTRSGSDLRMWEAMMPTMFAGSQYANRMPIGLMDVVMNFSYQTLRDYYHKWYRPDNQGIIVVGDIDAAAVEAQIKELFGSIPMPENAAERIYYTVPDNAEPIVALAQDKEATRTSVSIFFKHDGLPKELRNTAMDVVQLYMQGVVAQMLNARFEEMTQQPNAPFLGAYAYDSDFFVAKTKEAFTLLGVARTGEATQTLEALLTEAQRVAQHGFTASEYARAKADFLTQVESLYNERDKKRNSEYVTEYVNHFTSGGTIAGIEIDYQLINQVAPSLPLEGINQYAQELIAKENMVVTITGPEGETAIYPTEAEVVNLVKEAQGMTVDAYVDSVSDEPLLSETPQAGSVKKTTTDKRFGTTTWKLSNGATVVVKPTDFKDDEILMQASSIGGKSKYEEEDIMNLTLFDDVVSLGGLANFSATDLPKILAGKNASVSLSLGSYSESLQGSSSVKDAETLLQLIYLNMTNVRKDEVAFESWTQRMQSLLETRNANPQAAFSDTLMVALYDNSPWAKQPQKPADLDAVSYDRVLEIWSERYANAADFTFTFVGNIDLDTFKPLVEQYIASLPAKGKKEKVEDAVMEFREGVYRNEFDKVTSTPKTTVFAAYTGDAKADLEKQIQLGYLSQIMDIVYTKTIREEEGGTYGVGTSASMNENTDEWVFLFSFDTNAEQKEQLIARAKSELMAVVEEGAEEANVNKVKEYMLKKQAEQLRENSYWLGVIDNYYLTGNDDLTDYEAIVKAQTPASLSKMARKLFKQGNLTEVIMNGVAE